MCLSEACTPDISDTFVMSQTMRLLVSPVIQMIYETFNGMLRCASLSSAIYITLCQLTRFRFFALLPRNATDSNAFSLKLFSFL